MMFIRRQSFPPISFGIVAPLICFALLALSVWNHELSLVWDIAILEKIHTAQRIELDAIAFALTQLGRARSIMAIAFLVSIFLAWRKQWRSLSYLLVTVVSSGVLNLLIKFLFHRHRPALWDSIAPEFDFSFPSGHAMLSMTLVITLAILIPQKHWRSLFLFCGVMLAISIGWSRLYLGVHYPSDVLGGWALAIAWAIGVSWLSGVNVKL
ncbi:MAG: hypothetical protein DCF19_23890 [Pseudanabaena frigida]|uniref:Phosphatidic acid phosphatase type 2/haloperoxidase domain-containing protein n=1 Tax=Pseudanabaena frigida TaxID=945775 RepID=A0A2W4VSI0_9CYAN|nr:MAG: hypothetical protein DCF19_23890 [Pseudanabaena frigida]